MRPAHCAGSDPRRRLRRHDQVNVAAINNGRVNHGSANHQLRHSAAPGARITGYTQPDSTPNRRHHEEDNGTTKKTTVNSPPSEKSPLPPGALWLPSHESDHTPAAAWDNAAITGDATAGCVWIKDSDGKRHAALWPHGYYATFTPTRVFNEEGAEVWREGRLKDIGGGGSPVHVDRIPKRCRTGDTAWWVA